MKVVATIAFLSYKRT